MVFVADDLGAWLIGLLADAGRRRLTTLVLGTDQERALRRAATAAVELTAEELRPEGGERAEELARIVGQVFSKPVPDAPVAGQVLLLEALHAGIAGQLAPLDDVDLTGAGMSSAGLLGLSAGMLAQKLTGHLVRVIIVRGAGGGPLQPLASQLNHDVTHLQGRRLEGLLGQLAVRVGEAPARINERRPVRLAPRPVFLAGRGDLLAGLATRLCDGGEGTGPRMVALCGLGGVGKTSVAVEYAHRQLAGLGVVWQFGAEDPGVMAAEFVELAVLLGASDVLAGGDPVAAVHAVLAARPGGWLLVFDNAPDAAAVAGVLPPAGDGQVIITSQNPHWPGSRALEVPVLDQGAAAAFLMERTGERNFECARELAGELGGLPLALEQAAAYMRDTGWDIAGYLALYRGRRAELLARGEPAGYDKRVTTTWSLAFAQLEQNSPSAAGLLRLLACCGPDAIPYRLLLRPGPEILEPLAPEAGLVLASLLRDPLAVDDAITALRRYSLISPPTGGTVSVHRLVQAITLTQVRGPQASAWQQAAVALITAALPEDPEDPASWPAFAALLPHALAVLPVSSAAMMDIADYIGDCGRYAAARDLSEQVLDARQQELGTEHPRSLHARARLAYWTGYAGDVAAARDQFAALLPLRERISGPEHPDTMTIREYLAHRTGEAGDPAAARDQYAALLPVRERISGPEHRRTLHCRACLALWTGEAGDPAAARDQYAALLPLRERVTGAENPRTLTDRANFARWTGEAGDAAAARDQFAALLQVREQVSGAEHPRTLTVREYLARWTGEAGDAAGARDQFAALLPVRESVSGPEHPETVQARADLAYWTQQAESGAT